MKHLLETSLRGVVIGPELLAECQLGEFKISGVCGPDASVATADPANAPAASAMPLSVRTSRHSLQERLHVVAADAPSLECQFIDERAHA